MATRRGMVRAMAIWCDCSRPAPVVRMSLTEIEQELRKVPELRKYVRPEKTFREYWNDGVKWLRENAAKQPKLPMDVPWTDPRELEGAKAVKVVKKVRRGRKQLELIGRKS